MTKGENLEECWATSWYNIRPVMPVQLKDTQSVGLVVSKGILSIVMEPIYF